VAKRQRLHGIIKPTYRNFLAVTPVTD